MPALPSTGGRTLDPSARRWGRLRYIAGAALSLGILVYLVRSIGLETLRTRALGMDPWWLAGALLVACADRVLVILKWFPLVRALTPAVRFGAAARTYLAAMFASLVLPPYLGNDVVRAVALGRRERVIAEVGTSIVVERVLGLVTLGLLCLVSLALVLDRSGRVPLQAAWVVGGLGLGLLLFWLPLSGWGHARFARWRPTATGRWLGLIDRVAAAFAAYRRRPLLLWGLGALSFFEQWLVVAFYWMAAQALGVPADGRAVVAAVPLACFMARLPIGIWGLGIMEGSLVYLMGLFGVSAAGALATALVGRLVELGSILPGGLFLGELTAVVRGGGEPTEAGRAPHALDRLSARRT